MAREPKDKRLVERRRSEWRDLYRETSARVSASFAAREEVNALLASISELADRQGPLCDPDSPESGVLWREVIERLAGQSEARVSRRADDLAGMLARLAEIQAEHDLFPGLTERGAVTVLWGEARQRPIELARARGAKGDRGHLLDSWRMSDVRLRNAYREVFGSIEAALSAARSTVQQSRADEIARAYTPARLARAIIFFKAVLEPLLLRPARRSQQG